MIALRRALFLALAGMLAAAPASAHSTVSDPESALAISQAAIGAPVGDVTLRDGEGRVFMLSSLKGRPVVLSLVYSSCANTCPLITVALARAVAAAQEQLGPGRFSVLTVGFDTAADTPARMRAYARDQGIDLPDWHVAAIDAADAHRLMHDVGFIATPIAGGFDHLAQTTILDADGRVARQVYGDAFAAPAIVDPLLDQVLGQAAGKSAIDALVDRVTLFCTVYDPATGAYRFDYSLFFESIVGGTSIAVAGIFLWREWRRRARAPAS